MGKEPRSVTKRPKTFIDVVEFARTRLGFTPDANQAEILRSSARRGILNCSRQWGKSTITAAKAIYRALTRPASLILVASPSRRQSAEWMRKARTMVARAGIAPRGDGDNPGSILLPNGSRIVGLPGVADTVRGFSAVNMLVIDEAARVHDEIYESLRPMLLVSDGDIWMMSTPNGKCGFFYETWEHGGDEWLRVSGPATECGHISQRFLEEQRSAMTHDAFRQEHMCEFIGVGTALFDPDLIDAAFDDTLEAL